MFCRLMTCPRDGNSVPFVSDYFDFSIYIDADEKFVGDWYIITRFMRLRETAFRNPESFFHRYSEVSEDAAHTIALDLWTRINLANLHEKHSANAKAGRSCFAHKGSEHAVDHVALRRL